MNITPPDPSLAQAEEITKELNELDAACRNHICDHKYRIKLDGDTYAARVIDSETPSKSEVALFEIPTGKLFKKYSLPDFYKSFISEECSPSR